MRRHLPPSIAYQLFMLGVCLYALAALSFDLLWAPGTQSQRLLDYADTAVCALFALDFVICLVTAERPWRYVVTWGWLDLLSSVPMIGVARWGRAARVARILRVVRGARAASIVGGLIAVKRTESTLLAAALTTLLLLVTASLSILQVEVAPEANIKTAEDALWWALSTMTTVGYGDRFPVTTEGRVIAGVLMCAGVGLFGLLSGLLAAWFVTPQVPQGAGELQALRDEIAALRRMLSDSGRSARPTGNDES